MPLVRIGSKRRLIAVALLVLCAAVLPADEVKSLRIGDTTVDIVSYGFNEVQREARPKVALVLSGGGARGLAHIPVIAAIEHIGIPIDLVVGTSMGALVGGLYAAGYSPSDMLRLIAETDMVSLFAMTSVERPQPSPEPMRKSRENLFNMTFDAQGVGNSSGLIGDQRILTFLNDSLSRIAAIDDFDHLAIPFRCVGADAVTGEKVVFSEGSLVSAIRGSISIPIVFTPYPTGGRFIIDGGLVDNLPINLARDMGADIVIAVNVNASNYKITEEELSSITAMLSHMVTVVTKNTMVGQLVNADLVIEPDLPDFSTLDFFNIDPILELGSEAAVANQENLQVLADRISATRPLDMRDPDRYGVYFSLPDVYVSSVSHLSLPGSPADGHRFDLRPFQQFVGLPLDEKRKEQLEEMFEELRAEGYYATVSYEFNQIHLGKSDAVMGNLTIQTRAFPRKDAAVGIGVSGSSAVVFNPEAASPTRFLFLPDFSFAFTLENIIGSDVDLASMISYDDAFHVELGMSYPLVTWFGPTMHVRYSSGGLHPSNLKNSPTEDKGTDRLLTIDLAGAFWFSQGGQANIGFDLDLLWYGGVSETNPAWFAVVPAAKVEVVWADLPFGFFPRKGMRVEATTKLGGTSDGLVYRAEARFQKAFETGHDNTFWIDLHTGFSQSPYPIKGNYLEYGGVGGMAGYSSQTLVDEMVLVRIGANHRLGSVADFPLYLQWAFMVGASSPSTYDILSDNGSLVDTADPYGKLGSLEAGTSLSCGFSSSLGDFIIGVGVGFSGRFAVFVEFL